MADAGKINRESLNTNLLDKYNNLGGKYEPKEVDFFNNSFAKGFKKNRQQGQTDFTFKESEFQKNIDNRPYYPGPNIRTQ